MSATGPVAAAAVAKMESAAAAQALIAFIDEAVSPFHAVAAAAARLRAAGFEQVSEIGLSTRSVCPGARVFWTRGMASLVAMHVGGSYEAGRSGATIVAAHTDSPVLRVKPRSSREANGAVGVAVETYGGGLWHTWFDRDLSLAGRVFVADSISGKSHAKLVAVRRPLLKIPNLAIHLNRSVNTDGFTPNTETHLVPILASTIKAQLNSGSSDKNKDKSTSASSDAAPAHSPLLIQLLADELNVLPDAIRDFELSLFDTAPSSLVGLFDEFVSAPRLDNLLSSYCSLQALIGSAESIENDSNIRMIALFDHEEVGSQSTHGAGSDLLRTSLERIFGSEHYFDAIRRSLLVSADMAHALHPNYADKHESNHRPLMHKGVVIKYNSNQRYATNAETAFLVKEIARRYSIPFQEFMVRNDVGCGSTIGPILAANTGMRTVDVGVPQLGMHSIRETCGADDVSNAINLFRRIYQDFAQLDADTIVD